jgi:demethylmenaquinone methyltransferase/2-methoxy-6-polyprenyl-1,4-benzoquinol methylase
MFAGIASRYDLLNHLLSANIDKRWRKRVAVHLAQQGINKSSLVLDVACGTGDLSFSVASATHASVVGSDFCGPMLDLASRKSSESGFSIPFVEADAMQLPFRDGQFDAVTIAFGLRNLANWNKGIEELFRVLRPGGQLAILEFSQPVVPGFRQLFSFYFSTVLPRIGGVMSGSRTAYEYLPDSVARFPGQGGLADMIRTVGFERVEYVNLSGGIAALHTAIHPIRNPV